MSISYNIIIVDVLPTFKQNLYKIKKSKATQSCGVFQRFRYHHRTQAEQQRKRTFGDKLVINLVAQGLL